MLSEFLLSKPNLLEELFRIRLKRKRMITNWLKSAKITA